MKFKILLLSATFLIAANQHSYSADVTWNTVQTVAASTDVNTSGTLVDARGFGSSSQTVNGVAFGNTSNYSDTFNTPFTGYMGGQSFIGANNPEGIAYATLLDSGRYHTTSPLRQNFTLSNLTVGQDYLIQFWVADYRTFPNDRNLTISGGANSSGQMNYLDGDNSFSTTDASYVIGYFTADSTSQVFNLSANEDVQINAVQLRAASRPGARALAITNFTRQSSGDYIIDFVGAPFTAYQVTKSPDLTTPFGALTEPLEATTDTNGLGTATVPASEASEAKEFYRLATAIEFPLRSGLTAIDSNGQLDFDRAKWLARNNLIYQSAPSLNSESVPLGSGRVGAALWVDPANGLTAHLNRPEGVPAMGGLGTVRIRNLSSLTTLENYRGTLAVHDGIFTQEAGNLKVTSFFRWGGEELVIDVQGAPPAETVIVELSTYKNTHNTIASNVPGAEISGANCIAVCGADGSLPNSYPDFRATQFLAAQAAGTNVVAASNANGATLTFKPHPNGTYRVVIPVKIWTGNLVNLTSLKSEALAATAAPLATDPFTSMIATQKAAFQAMWENCAMIRLASKDGETRYIEQMIVLDTYIRLSAALTPLPAAGGGETRMFSWRPTPRWALYNWYQNLRPLNYANIASGLTEANFATWNTFMNWQPALRQHAATTFPTYEGTAYPEFTDGQPGTAGSLLTSQSYQGQNLTQPSVRWYHSRNFSTTLEIISCAIAEYRYRQDETFLTNRWPMIREGMLFHRSLLMSSGLGTDGKYHYLSVNSRENNWDDDDDMPDVSNIRALLPVVMELALTRGDTTLYTKLNDLVGKLPDFPTTTRDGVTTLAWSAVTRDTGHNEENPDLDAIWPANAIGDTSEPALIELANNTLDKRVFKESYDWHPTTVQAARMGRADLYQSALLYGIEKFLVYSQGFSSWNGGTTDQDIDTEFTAVQSYAAHEALVQNYDGLLRFANAWPSNWEAIAWLPTEGGHRVGLEVVDGTLQVASIDLGSSSPAMRIRNPWPGQTFSIRDLTDNEQLYSGDQAIATVAAINGHRLLIEKSSKPLSSFSYQAIVDYPNNRPNSLGSRRFGKARTR